MCGLKNAERGFQVSVWGWGREKTQDTGKPGKSLRGGLAKWKWRESREGGKVPLSLVKSETQLSANSDGN